eukprot:CAMPEP_0198509542 /NCGR_PEP_ID=MMETSP1462-20131121/13625_1 /TAXON_ID=1333877 /ORGANISM="Brandtodinium nutriculum, Strain RCC3387" /LENGTH=73 /DNA_ID=CAMNT_0044238849 /DNA_START=225 /DNA_END=442 /DNA_ORIENTATION=-
MRFDLSPRQQGTLLRWARRPPCRRARPTIAPRAVRRRARQADLDARSMRVPQALLPPVSKAHYCGGPVGPPVA